MTGAHLQKTLAGLVLVIIVIIFAYAFRVQTLPPAPDDSCGAPPAPFYSTAANLDLALANTLAVFKGTAEPKVIDVIPSEARTLEMIGFLSCKAQKAGLLSTNDELREYTALLGDIARGNEVPKYVRHFGKLSTLQTNLRKSRASPVMLTISEEADQRLREFWVDEIIARTWKDWFNKMCAQYASCLACNPSPGDVTDRIEITTTRPLNVSKVQKEDRVGC